MTATAINAGTAAYFAFWMVMHSISCLLHLEQTVYLYEFYFKTVWAAHAGQALDIAGQQHSDLDDILSGHVDPSILKKQVISVHCLKMATVAENLAKMSAIIADASPTQINALSTHFE